MTIIFTKPMRQPHKAQRGVSYRTKETTVLGIKGVSSQDARTSVPGMQGDGFASEPGGIMEVAMWLCSPLLVGL